jgi:hypothetical protein
LLRNGKLMRRRSGKRWRRYGRGCEGGWESWRVCWEGGRGSAVLCLDMCIEVRSSFETLTAMLKWKLLSWLQEETKRKGPYRAAVQRKRVVRCRNVTFEVGPLCAVLYRTALPPTDKRVVLCHSGCLVRVHCQVLRELKCLSRKKRHTAQGEIRKHPFALNKQ